MVGVTRIQKAVVEKVDDYNDMKPLDILLNGILKMMTKMS